MFFLPKQFAQGMIEHAQRESPNECCGLLAGVGGRPTQVYPATNAENSPLRYSLEPKQLLGYLREIEEKGWELLGIYHSHTHSQAYPSATDIQLAFWPDSFYIIISLAEPQHPVMRAFRIREGKVTEEELRIVAD